MFPGNSKHGSIKARKARAQRVNVVLFDKFYSKIKLLNFKLIKILRSGILCCISDLRSGEICQNIINQPLYFKVWNSLEVNQKWQTHTYTN